MPSKSHYRLLAAVLGLGLGAWLLAGRADEPATPSAPGDNGSDDPFRIQRVLLTPDRLGEELKRVENGTLVRLPRTDFERRVRLAAAAKATAIEPPRLVEAHYRAKLLSDSLEENSIVGSAEWKIVHLGPGAGLLPLDALHVAL